MKKRRLNVFFRYMSAEGHYLFRVQPNKNAAVPSAVLGPFLNLIQDELEPEQTDLKHEWPLLDLMIPIQGKAEGCGVEGERALGVLDEEDASSIEIIHRRTR